MNDDIAARETAVPVHRLADGIRALRIADIRQRTDIHAYFNTVLRTACGRAGFKFVDAFTPFLGADGLLDPRYIQPERFGTDHHLDARQTHGVVAGLIWQCITAARRFP